uniref:Serine/threonine-protein kinase tricorner n=1 Tax=Rhizophora mucronata TaxID=61149 RepID=A0A2P2L201_RHIMU
MCPYSVSIHTALLATSILYIQPSTKHLIPTAMEKQYRIAEFQGSNFGSSSNIGDSCRSIRPNKEIKDGAFEDLFGLMSAPELSNDLRTSDFLKVNPMKLLSFDVNICTTKEAKRKRLAS